MGLFGASDPTVPASSNDVEQSRRIRTFSLGSTDTTGTRVCMWISFGFFFLKRKKSRDSKEG